MSTFNIFCHAALMIGAWMWLIPTGILTAVYKKRFGPGWIKLHMPLQVRGYSKGGGGHSTDLRGLLSHACLT